MLNTVPSLNPFENLESQSYSQNELLSQVAQANGLKELDNIESAVNSFYRQMNPQKRRQFGDFLFECFNPAIERRINELKTSKTFLEIARTRGNVEKYFATHVSMSAEQTPANTQNYPTPNHADPTIQVGLG